MQNALVASRLDFRT